MCQVKRGGNPPTDFDNILHVVAKDNNIFKLQGLLEQNDSTNKPTSKNYTCNVNIYIQLT